MFQMNSRLSSVRKLLTKKRLDAILVSSVPNITYLTNYSGFLALEREAYLFITKNHHYLFTDGRYTEAVRNIPHFTLIEITPINPLQKALVTLTKQHKIKKIGIDENSLTVSEYKKLKKHFNDIYHFSDIATLRAVKEVHEIAAIEKACRLGDKTFTYVLNKIKKGVSEKEVAFEIEFFIKKYGADISFSPIVAFGKNSAIPHHQSSNKPLAISDNLVLLDFGVKMNNYCSDMTRTVFFGKASAEQKRMYQTVLDAQQKAMEELYQLGGGRTDFSEVNARGINAKDVDKAARDCIISQGFPFIPHSLGHGIGLQVHELPRLSPKSKDRLVPGMVFSIEPGIYIPGFGGVRIEDLVVLEKSGLPRRKACPRLLTKSSNKIIEL